MLQIKKEDLLNYYSLPTFLNNITTDEEYWKEFQEDGGELERETYLALLHLQREDHIQIFGCESGVEDFYETCFNLLNLIQEACKLGTKGLKVIADEWNDRFLAISYNPKEIQVIE